MIKEATGVGKSVDDAIAAACRELGCDRDSCTIEVLELPAKRLLGFLGSTNAKVKVTADIGVFSGKNENSEDKEKPENLIKRKNVELMPAQQKVEAYLNEILTLMGIKEYSLNLKEEEEILYVTIEGKELGAVIGKRGETLDALQYLASLIGDRESKTYRRVVLDAGNYREKRRQFLIRSANSAANRVLRNHRNIALEPMNPYERRIVHTAVQEIEGVTSWSVGEDPNRKVIVGMNFKKNMEEKNAGRGTDDTRRRPDNSVPNKEPRIPRPKRDVKRAEPKSADFVSGENKSREGEEFSLYQKILPVENPGKKTSDEE